MASNNSNIKAVPEAMDALEKFKYEVASEVGVKNLFKKINIFYPHLSYFIFINTYINLLSYFFYLQFCILAFYFLLNYLCHLIP